MLPVIQAKEQLADVNAAALANPQIEGGARREALRALEQRASGAKPQRAEPAAPKDLAEMGIALTVTDGPEVSGD